MKFKIEKLLKYLMIYAILLVIAAIVLVPTLWIILASFNEGTSIFGSSLIPENPTLKHYFVLFLETDYPKWFVNTLKISFLNMLVSLTITLITAVALSRYKFKGKKISMMVLLILQMFPAILAMAAIYVILVRLKLNDSIIGLVLVYASGQIPFNTWMTKGYLDGIPKSLDEAAKVDGATNFQIITKVIIPLAKPIMIFVAFQNFVTPWFDFVFPQLILRNPENYTLAMGIYKWVAYQSQTNFTMFAAGAVLVTIPITILWAVFQKYIITGLTSGAVKG